MLESERETYFFQQRCDFKTTKRFRKNPEDLPQELRYAHLNPRVAAYLATKDKEQKIAEAEDLCDGLGEKSLLPQIHQSVSLIRQRLDHLLPHTEDAQRMLFDEARQTSDRLLVRLANLLCMFEDIHVEIPPELEDVLQSGYKQLTSDVKYVARDWQCVVNKDAYLQQVLARSLSSTSTTGRKDDIVSVAGSSVVGTDDERGKDGDTSRRVKRRSSKSGVLADIVEVEEKKSKHQKKKDAVVRMSVTKERRKIKNDKGRSILSTSGKSTTVDSRSQRYLSVPKHDVETSLISSNRREKDCGYWMTINFQLSSKLCDDKGWIVHPTSNTEMERNALLQWAIEQLRVIVKMKQQENCRNKLCGNDAPLILRYYGDQRDEMIIRHRSGTDLRLSSSKTMNFPQDLPTVPSMHFPEMNRALFMCALPDGSSTIFYPTGYPAIVQSRSPDVTGCYAFVYSNSPDHNLLACFTPAGRAAVYHTNGAIHLLVTNTGGTVALPDGEVTRRWSWPPNNGRLASSISIALNNAITVRCSSQSQMYLTFNCEKETRKVNVGMTTSTTTTTTTTTTLVAEEQTGSLLSGVPFMSKAAKECLKTAKGEKSKVKVGVGKVVKKVKVKTPNDAEAEKILDFDLLPSANDHEADKVLHRLQGKAKELVDNWMEHYCLALRFSTPCTLRDPSQRINRVRLVQSASGMRSLSTSGDSARIPSAPAATHLGRRRHREVAGSKAQPKMTLGDYTKAIDQIGSAENRNENIPTVTVTDESDGAIIRSELTYMLSSQRPPITGPAGAGPGITLKVMPPSIASSSLFSEPRCVSSCPVALRQQILQPGSGAGCKCHVPTVPYVTDVEFDTYIQKCVPHGQVLVIAVISSLYPEESATIKMLDRLYAELNAGRSHPCQQNTSDLYRIVYYDLPTAAHSALNTQPLLFRRHNVAAGMIMIYKGGKLLFCDHIFNGYGNERKDFEKQIHLLQQSTASGQSSLPMDFHFSPQKGRHGARAAWGGEIGGAGVDRHGNCGLTLLEDVDSSSSLVMLEPTTHHRYRLTLACQRPCRSVSSVVSSSSPRSHVDSLPSLCTPRRQRTFAA